MDITEHLKAEFDRTAKATGLKPTTIGRMVGQGGHFYRRLCEGKRVWPETAESVLEYLKQIRSPSSDASKGCSPATDSLPDKKRGDAPADIQGQGVS